jgi:hypothetical protein
MDKISKLERAKKRLSPAEIRTLFADLAEPFVPGLGAVREGMAGNYGTAAVSGLLDLGGPIGKGVGLAAAPLMGMMKGQPVEGLLKSLGFSSDVPNQQWLAEKIEDATASGLNKFGAPRSFGTWTGGFSSPLLVPVDVLKKIPGVMGEQKNVRKDSLDFLMKEMKSGQLPKIDDREYRPFITVDYLGRPFVSEGNHRIMAAEKLGFKYLPVDVRYFNGGELQRSGFSPEDLALLNEDAKKRGFSVSKYSK